MASEFYKNWRLSNCWLPLYYSPLHFRIPFVQSQSISEMISRRMVDSVYLKKPIGGRGFSPDIEVYGRTDAEQFTSCMLIVNGQSISCSTICVSYIALSSIVWLVSQVVLLIIKLGTPLGERISLGLTYLIPATCFLGILAFSLLGTLIYTRLCIRNDVDDAKGRDSNRCCNWVLFGFVIFSLSAFAFMIMLSLSLSGYFDL